MKNSRVCAYINYDNILYNLQQMKGNISPETRIMAVIKTNAYGHGAVEIAKRLEGLDYIAGFAVATIEEALQLREAGIKKLILILGFVFPESYPELVREDIRCAVFKYEQGRQLSEEAVRQKKEVYFHIKLDTGMGRIGFVPCQESADCIESLSRLPGVKMEGIFTHFAKADMRDKAATYEQIRKFKDFYEHLERKGIHFDLHHCSNSAGIIRFPEANMDMVRAGITLYGLWPSEETERNIISLKPVMSLKSHIAYIKEVDRGCSISYGGTYVAEGKRRIATIPVGYGDGYPRLLSGKGEVLIRGKRAPITGRVCMDQFMADVTDIEGAEEFDQVTLIGRDGSDEITMEELGGICGRFNYELACDIGSRVPRVMEG